MDYYLIDQDFFGLTKSMSFLFDNGTLLDENDDNSFPGIC